MIQKEVKQELIEKETTGFVDSIKNRREIKAWLKAASIYADVVKPYTNAKELLEQAEYYAHYEELEKRYFELQSVSAAE